jgi:hypothetical protein
VLKRLGTVGPELLVSVVVGVRGTGVVRLVVPLHSGPVAPISGVVTTALEGVDDLVVGQPVLLLEVLDELLALQGLSGRVEAF